MMVSSQEPSALVSALSLPLAAAGFDLTGTLDACAFNRPAQGFRLETFQRQSALAVVVGNTRVLWPTFMDRYQRLAALRRSPNPLDAYTEQCINEALQPIVCRHRVYFGHHTGPEVVPLQRLAEAAGVGELSPSHLNVHPIHGPWIALRALVVFDHPAPLNNVKPSSHCRPCQRPCLSALTRALRVD
jgi:methylmalonic aciduria homocystinuria type C protein